MRSRLEAHDWAAGRGRLALRLPKVKDGRRRLCRHWHVRLPWRLRLRLRPRLLLWLRLRLRPRLLLWLRLRRPAHLNDGAQ